MNCSKSMSLLLKPSWRFKSSQMFYLRGRSDTVDTDIISAGWHLVYLLLEHNQIFTNMRQLVHSYVRTSEPEFPSETFFSNNTASQTAFWCLLPGGLLETF